MTIDYSVYPDLDDLPETLKSPSDKADYVARVCSAWDFGIFPTPETFELFRSWREVFDQYPSSCSPSYCAFRSWYGWPTVEPGPVICANYERLDKRRASPDPWLEKSWTLDTVRLMTVQPQCPDSLDPIAVELLTRLQPHPTTSSIVLGGHFALKHYLDYRSTHDIDAWWDMQSTAVQQGEAMQAVKTVMQQMAQERNWQFSERSTKLVKFFEFKHEGKTIFSFQIAERDVELGAPLNDPWKPIKIEALEDNVGEKMNALVNRGAPRDFVDIRAVVVSNLLSVNQVWNLWQQKNIGLDLQVAKAEVLRHLESIELRRPLNQVPLEQREEIERSCRWIKEQLLQLPYVHRRGPRL